MEFKIRVWSRGGGGLGHQPCAFSVGIAWGGLNPVLRRLQVSAQALILITAIHGIREGWVSSERTERGWSRKVLG